MPNGALALNVDVAKPAILLGSAFMAGGLQRVAWEISVPLGFITTGAMAIGGTVGSFILDGLGATLSEGIAASGAALSGWILTEQFLIPSGPSKGKIFGRRSEITAEQREALGGSENSRVDGLGSIAQYAAQH